MNRNIFSVIICVLFLLAFVVEGEAEDKLFLKGNEEHTGRLESYKNGKFNFKPDGKTPIHELRTFTEKLVMDPPAVAVVTHKTKREKIEGMKLKRYEKGAFVFDKDGKEVKILAMQISTIEIQMSGGGWGGGGASSSEVGDLQVDMKALAAWMNENETTPEQKKAFDDYKSARAAYDSFQAESSRLIDAMDNATGAAREQLLNDLRIRKNEEQPILNALGSAEKALLATFPELTGDAPVESPEDGEPVGGEDAGGDSLEDLVLED